jgi:uncharacterized protein (TIGR02217 family)
MAIRFDRECLLVQYTPNASPYQRFTTSFVEALGARSGYRQTRMTQAFASFVGTLNIQETGWKFTENYLLVLSTWTPKFHWVDDMFMYEVFPYDISYNSIGATKFSTDVIVVDSGDDQRLQKWLQPLMEYDIAYGVRTMEQLQGLIAFFRAMRGRLYGFLYDDPMDNTSTIATRTEARSAPAATPTDQIIGMGDGQTKTFQLVKTYRTPKGTVSFVRPIMKPKPDTVRVAINGAEVQNFNVDYTQGLITFTSPLTLNYLPTLSLSASAPGTVIVAGSAGCFATLQVGQRLIMYGWLNAVNNTSEGQVVVVTAKSGDSNQITLSVPVGVGETESNRPGVHMYVHPAPPNGVSITAGYGFFVPVRFDTDRLPLTFEEYGIGSGSEIKLVEIRPGEAL